MGTTKEAWLDLLENFEHRGRHWGQNGASQPPDEAALWAEARIALGDLLPEHPDPVRLAELRAAYEKGRTAGFARHEAMQAAIRAQREASHRVGQLQAAVAAEQVRDVFPAAATVAFYPEQEADGWKIDLVSVRDAASEPLWRLPDWLTDEPDDEPDEDAATFEDDSTLIRDALAAALRHGVTFPSAIGTRDAQMGGHPALLHIEQALAAAGVPWAQEQAAGPATQDG